MQLLQIEQIEQMKFKRIERNGPEDSFPSRYKVKQSKWSKIPQDDIVKDS